MNTSTSIGGGWAGLQSRRGGTWRRFFTVSGQRKNMVSGGQEMKAALIQRLRTFVSGRHGWKSLTPGDQMTAAKELLVLMDRVDAHTEAMYKQNAALAEFIECNATDELYPALVEFYHEYQASTDAFNVMTHRLGGTSQ